MATRKRGRPKGSRKPADQRCTWEIKVKLPDALGRKIEALASLRYGGRYDHLPKKGAAKLCRAILTWAMFVESETDNWPPQL